MLKRALAVFAVLLPLLAATACGSDSNTAADPAGTPSDTTSATAVTSSAGGTGVSCSYLPDGTGAGATTPPSNATVSGTIQATIHTTEGDVPIALNADHAPCTVNSFVSLAQQKFFDDTPCHRLTTSGIYVLQCGDPTGTGMGGPGYSYADETTKSDTYRAGTLAMANAGPNTNGSQFFLCYDSCDGLDPQPGQKASYTVFGTISSAGMAVLKKIAQAGENDANGPGDGAPNDHVKITSVTVG